jgi:hypothetical protein
VQAAHAALNLKYATSTPFDPENGPANARKT